MAKNGKNDQKGETGPDTPAKGRSGLGPVGMISIGLAAVASSAGATVLLSPPSAPAATACETTGERPRYAAPLAKENQAYVELDELIVTVGSAPATRFLKIRIAIATDEEKTGKVEEATMLLKDAFLKYLRSMELEAFEDPASYARMREQLALRAEVVLGGDVSNGILITEYLLR